MKARVACGILIALTSLWAWAGAKANPTLHGLVHTFYSPYNSLQTTSIAEMTPAGTVSEHLLSLNLSDITKDPNGLYYGAYQQSVWKIDPATYMPTLLPVVGPGVVDPSWPIALTFDTTRNHVVLATLAGEGFFFSHDPISQQWALMSSIQNVDLQSIVYRPANDTIYALPNNSLGTSIAPINALYRYSASGVFQGTTSLLAPILGGAGIADGNYQIMLTSDDRLAVLTPPVMHPTQGLSTRLYLVDPATGAITYDNTFPAVPEPAGCVGIVVFLGLQLRNRGRR